LEINDIIMEHYGLAMFPEKVSKAMAYVPFQSANSATYPPAQGFEYGTMFPSLNKPFYGSKCGEKNE
jgi:hypothetical protein